MLELGQPRMDDASTKQFFAACGGGQAQQLLVSANRAGMSTYSLRRPYLIIGSAPACDVQLDLPEVSYRHAYLQIIGGRICCLDLASRCGTYQRALRRKSFWVDPGEEFSISAGTFRLMAEGEAAPGTQVLTAADQPLPEVRLSFVNGRDFQHERTTWLPKRELTLVGWSRICKFQLIDDSVSRVHASLLLTPAGLWVVDLLGKDGIKVNDEPVAFRLLANGDRLAIGRFQFEATYSGRSAPRQVRHAVPTHDDRHDSRLRQPSAPPLLAQMPAAAAGELSSPLWLPAPARSHPLSASSGTELSETFVIALVNQFAAMQQQMFEDTQQLIVAMARMYSSMHEDQLKTVREELVRVDALTRELEELRAEIATWRSESQSQPSVEAAAPAETSHEQTSEEMASQPGPGARADEANLSEPTGAGDRAVGDEADLDQLAEPTEPVDASAEPPAAASETLPAAGAEESPDEVQKGMNMHMQLLNRMAVLEKERTTRWQRIIRAVTGVSGESDRHLMP